ncbi:MAG: 30S ribosomal protein S20, partial [Candidatus Paceibacteria bacterium]
MPITKSAKKALRQSLKRQALNLKRKQKILKIIKKYKKTLSLRDSEGAKKLLPQVFSALDKAAKT